MAALQEPALERDVRIVVGDPQPLIAEGLRSWLRDEQYLSVVGHAADGDALLELVALQPCELVVMEVGMPRRDGIDTMRALHHTHPGLPVLAHSTLIDVEYVGSMLVEGACGYLVKGGPREEFIAAVRTVMGGHQYVSDLARTSLDRGYTYTEKRPGGEYIGLTTREREIIRLVALERTNGEIAAALHISEDTVKTHRKNLMTKLNVRSAAGLVKYAIDRRWI